MRTIAIIVLLASTARSAELPLSQVPPAPPLLALDLPPPAAPPSSATDGLPNQERPAILTSWKACEDCYQFNYSNGAKLEETYVDYSRRTGKPSPATSFCCTSGHCGTAAAKPTLATGGCVCGCNAELCSCAHSPNVGKPLAKQEVKPGMAASSSQNYSRGRFRLFGRFR